jgi:hypothetical protein
MRRIRYIVSVSVFVIFFNGCKTKHIVSGVSVINPIDESDLVKMVDEVDPNIEIAFFKRTSIRVKTENESQSFKSNIFFKKDSFIRVSVLAPMGIEIARISLEPDKVIVIDRINRLVVFTDYDEVYNRFGVETDYKFLQNILLDKAFSYFEADGINLVDYYGGIEDRLYKLASVKERQYKRLIHRSKEGDIVFHSLWINPEFFYLKKTSFFIKKGNINVDVVYDGFNKNFSEFYFPNKMIIDGQKDGKSFSFDVSYGSIQFNEDNNISFNIPQRYEKVYR